MKNSLLLLIICISILGCHSKSRFIFEDAKQKYIKPDFIKNASFLEQVISDKGSSYYWIEYVGIDSILKKNYSFRIYDINGKLLGKYYYFLMDTDKFKNKKEFFSDYRTRESIERIDADSFRIIADNNQNKIFIANNKKYLMLEYIPRDMNPNNKMRKKYFEFNRPINLPEHAVIIENTETDFSYIWRVVKSTEMLKGGYTKICAEEYDDNGKFLEKMSFNVKNLNKLNFNNYSFERSLFIDENLFINNGIRYTMMNIDDSSNNCP